MTTKTRAAMLDRIDRALTMLDCAEAIRDRGGSVEIGGVRITRAEPTHRAPCADGDVCGEAAHCPPAAASFAPGGVITADQVRRMPTPALDAINRPAPSAGLGDALRALMDDADPFWVAEKLADLAARADALEAERDQWQRRFDRMEAERDRLADERNTLRAALDQERRSMATRLTVLERIKGERDVARAAVGRVWALLDDETERVGALSTYRLRNALDGDEGAGR